MKETMGCNNYDNIRKACTMITVHGLTGKREAISLINEDGEVEAYIILTNDQQDQFRKAMIYGQKDDDNCETLEFKEFLIENVEH